MFFQDPIHPAANLTATLAARGGGGKAALAELRADHARWWSDFWATTAHIEIPESPAAEKMWCETRSCFFSLPAATKHAISCQDRLGTTMRKIGAEKKESVFLLRYGSLYILASGNRERPTRLAAGRYGGDGRLPPPMGLVWPKTSDNPAFSGSYTMNYVRVCLHTAYYVYVCGCVCAYCCSRSCFWCAARTDVLVCTMCNLHVYT